MLPRGPNIPKNVLCSTLPLGVDMFLRNRNEKQRFDKTNVNYLVIWHLCIRTGICSGKNICPWPTVQLLLLAAMHVSEKVEEANNFASPPVWGHKAIFESSRLTDCPVSNGQINDGRHNRT
jgi:hypothetical protein